VSDQPTANESAEKAILRNEKGHYLKGNPGGPGRPKGSMDALTILRRKCEAEADGKPVEELIYSVLDAMRKAATNDKPDPAAARIFLDRTCGAVKQEHEITSNTTILVAAQARQEIIHLMRNGHDAVLDRIEADE
jgi:hypothetical protein